MRALFPTEGAHFLSKHLDRSKSISYTRIMTYATTYFYEREALMGRDTFAD